MSSTRYSLARDLLTSAGLDTVDSSFTMGDLNAFAEQRGWRVSTERLAVSQFAKQSWRATVLAASPVSYAKLVTSTGTFGRGHTEAEALTIALASMIRRVSVLNNADQHAA